MANLKADLEKVNLDKEDAVRDQNFERAAALRDQERDLQNQIRLKQEEWERERQTRRPVIGEEEIAFIVSRWTGIPVTRLQEAETARLLRMEDELHLSVVGQDEAIKAISRAIRRSRAGLKDPEASDRLVHLLRPHRRRKDRAGPGAGQVPVRRPLRADPGGYVGVHGEVLGEPADRRPAGLRRATKIPAR